MSKGLPLVVVVGPTASGKTTFALELAQRFNGEIICADSKTVYKHMDIGTAKPSKKDQALIPHHLLDIVEPNEGFSVATFKKLALKAIDDIQGRKKLPILVGGTGLYLNAVLFDFTFNAPPPNHLREQLQKLTTDELYTICSQNNIKVENKNNRRHLVRAIEVGGHVPNNAMIKPHTIVVGIATQRIDLLSRIVHRTEVMIKQGVLKEVEKLGESYGWSSEAMTASIYKILRPVIEGNKPLARATEEVIKSDLALAKRQMTWFKRNPHIIWGSPSELMQKVAHFLD